MNTKINFIGRDEEIEKILRYLKGNSDMPGKVIFISGEGGIGKTRLLNELIARIKKDKEFVINQVVDFDDKRFNNPESINLFMIDKFPNNERFSDYLTSVDNFRKIEKFKASKETLKKGKEKLTDEFVETYNELVGDKHIWVFDTVEKSFEFDEKGKEVLKINKDIINEWVLKIPHLKNTFFIFSGRPSGIKLIRAEFSKHNITSLLIKLGVFSKEESRDYIAAIQKNFNLSIKKEQAEKLIELADKKPIFLDLAVEWFVQEVDMAFLNEIRISGQKIPVQEQREFEKKLVSKISELRSPLDSVTFALAHVYPLNNGGFSRLFENKGQDGIDFEGVKKIVYIKTLPSGAIKLHDEMERLVEEHLFNTIDKNLNRRKYYSKKYLPYLQGEYDKYEKAFTRGLQEGIESENKKEKLDARISHEENRAILDDLANQLIIHSFFADPQKQGKPVLTEVSKRMTKDGVNALLKDLDKFSRLLSFGDDLEFIMALAGLLLYVEKYDAAKEKLNTIIHKANDEQRVKINLLLSNIAVRKGKVNDSIKLLEEAEAINNKLGNEENHIKLEIELGWNYRLIGDFKKARDKYEAAINDIFRKTEGNWPEFQDLATRYGWTLNNLAFVLSNFNDTRRDAVDYANSAISHWQSIGDELGLGAGYSVSGITYYRTDNYENAIRQFAKAMEIFEKRELDDWLCQVYSWRGATYQDKAGLGYSAEAERDFIKALEIAEKANRQIIPMTLNRLGRVYMAKGDWPRALEKMKESLHLAKGLPDYFYWLGSIGRIALILSIDSTLDYKLEDLEREYKEFNEAIQKRNIIPHQNQLGITKIAFASLRLIGLRDKPEKTKVDEVIDLLKEGIPLVTKYGSYGRTDIESRLKYMEEKLSEIEPALIKRIGGELLDFIKGDIMDHSSYITVVNILNKWKNWKDDK